MEAIPARASLPIHVITCAMSIIFLSQKSLYAPLLLHKFWTVNLYSFMFCWLIVNIKFLTFTFTYNLMLHLYPTPGAKACCSL